MKISKKYLFVFLAIIAIFSGCGYTAKNILPENVKTIKVSIFNNKTLQYKVENILTDKIIENFIMDGRLKISSSNESDSILTGEIVQFLKQPSLTDKNNNVLEYKLTLVINIVLKDNNNKIIGEYKNIKESYNYYAERQSEQETIDLLIKNLSRRIVYLAIEGE